MARHYAGAAYGGASEGATSGGIIVDPSRPNVGGWQWLTAGSAGPFAGRAYTGGGAVGRPAAGGISVLPDPDSAAALIDAWWSGAPYLRLVRIVDGLRNPVRNGFPVVTSTATRRNGCTNPSGEVSTEGWNAGTNTTVTNPAAAAATHGTRVIRLTATAAGQVSTSVPCQLDPLTPTLISLDVRVSAAPSGALTVTAQWVDSTGAALPSSTASVPSLAAYTAMAPVTRTPVLTVVPPAGAAEGALTLAVAGVAAGAVVDLDGVLIGDDGDYFDGDDVHGSWALTPHLSSSQLAGVHQIVDREVPFDVDVVYEMTAPDQPGFKVLSQPVVVASQRRTWLSHPYRGLPVQVNVHREPERTYAIEQGVHKVVGRRRPVVVSAAARQADTGTITIDTADFFERDRMHDLLDDGSPLLIRSPAALGHGPGEWMAFGDVGVTSAFGDALEDSPRFFELPYTAVDPPTLPDIG